LFQPAPRQIPDDAVVLKIKFPSDRLEKQIINLIAKYVAKEGYALEVIYLTLFLGVYHARVVCGCRV
jgi:hypothetical protein